MHWALELIKSQSKPIGLNSSYGDNHEGLVKRKGEREWDARIGCIRNMEGGLLDNIYVFVA